MICRIVRFPFSSLLLFLFLVLSFSFTLTNNSYAVSDISVTYTSVPSNYSPVFPDCTGSCLDDYSYLRIDSSFVDWTATTFNSIEFRFDETR